MSEQSKCSGCGAPLRWVKTEVGKWLLLDAEPAADGTVVVCADGLGRVLMGGLFDEPATGPLYRVHGATCKEAHRFRKRGKKS